MLQHLRSYIIIHRIIPHKGIVGRVMLNTNTPYSIAYLIYSISHHVHGMSHTYHFIAYRTPPCHRLYLVWYIRQALLAPMLAARNCAKQVLSSCDFEAFSDVQKAVAHMWCPVLHHDFRCLPSCVHVHPNVYT